MHYMDLFSKAGNIFRQPRALQAANAMLQGNLSLTPSKLFVGGLSSTTDVDILRDVFGRFGKIVDVLVISNRETGVSKGFGFVTYDSIDAANKAMQQMNDQRTVCFLALFISFSFDDKFNDLELDGRIIGVNPADSGGGGGGLARRGGRGGFGRGGYNFVR
ncbi:hypothetical protein F2Q69_00027026 [Brassica cretica]|uniref:RRM domain-containing protein n=1 Tax=Brassica cretica TaxID=69181 RepID=A0A8S9RXH8_BRACR|nr:hypothetical protein F2Q69_00027026 [Brassica cretica]